MKKLIFLLVASVAALSMASCSLINNGQIQEYVSPQNVALVTFSALLKSKPEAAPTCAKLEDDLLDLAQTGVLDINTAYSKIAESIQGSDLKEKKAVLVAIRALFNEYEYVFDTSKLDFSAYALTLKQFAAGIEQALTIYDADMAQIRTLK